METTTTKLGICIIRMKNKSLSDGDKHEVEVEVVKHVINNGKGSQEKRGGAERKMERGKRWAEGRCRRNPICSLIRRTMTLLMITSCNHDHHAYPKSYHWA